MPRQEHSFLETAKKKSHFSLYRAFLSVGRISNDFFPRLSAAMTGTTMTMASKTTPVPPARRVVYRHSAWVRLTHWINVLCLTLLLMSGLQIFNAHSALYLGSKSNFNDPVLSIGANADEARGQTTILGHEFNTTGALGFWRGPPPVERAFPSAVTLPSVQDLATGRRWHFTFAWLLVANGALVIIYGLASGHFRKDIWPGWRDLKHIPRSIVDHARLRFATGEEARHYNVLQKLSYGAILFLVLPGIVLAGLTMSPAMDAAAPWLLTLFGGRQSARTVHFILAFTLVAFVIVHVAMVFLSGPLNNLRSIITGRYAIEDEGKR
jgi:thiosulfate reductase cytochrome b subunit